MANRLPLPEQSTEGMIFVQRGDHLVPLGDDEIAPFAATLLPLVREALAPLCDRQAGWANQNPEIANQANRLRGLLDGEEEEIAAASPSLWFLSVNLAARIQADDRALADPIGMTEPLPPECRVALDTLMHILPGFVRAFPKARELDTARTAFLRDERELETARGLPPAAADADIIAPETAAIIADGFEVGGRDVPVAEKGARASLWSVRNLAGAGVLVLAGAFSSELAAGVVDATGLRAKIAEFVRRRGEEMVAAFASAPVDLKLAMEQNVAFYQSTDGAIPPPPFVRPKQPPPGGPLKPGQQLLVVDQKEGEGDFSGISDAIAAAEDGARIVIRPGVYAETVTLEKALELIGDGQREEIVIAVSSGLAAMHVTANIARVAGLTLRRDPGEGDGVALWVTAGRAEFEDCAVASRSIACAQITGAGTAPVFRRCRFHDGAEAGLIFYEGARGLVEDCESTGNGFSGVQIIEGADPVLRRCVFRGNRRAGAFVTKNGRGTFEDCEIVENGNAGVWVRKGGRPTVRGCRIGENTYEAIWIPDAESGGTFEDNDLRGNKHGAWDIAKGAEANVTRRDNVED